MDPCPDRRECNRLSEWKKLAIFLLASLLALVPSANPTSAQDPERDPFVLERVTSAPEALVTDPNNPELSLIANALQYGESSFVSTRHTYLDPGQVLRVIPINSEWAMVLPEYDQLNPQTYNSTHEVYVPISSLETLSPEFGEPLSVYPKTQQYDRLIVVIDNQTAPQIMAYEGNNLVFKGPAVLGPTPHGDFRIWRKRASDDMPGIPGVPFSQCFSGGYCLHGAPWWNWSTLAQGHYGSHGCVNLPDHEWYELPVDGQNLSVDEWLFRWTNSGLPYSFAPENSTEEIALSSEDPGWYQPTKSVRVLVVNSIEDLKNFPLTSRLGPDVRDAAVTSWQTLIDDYNAHSNTWVLPSLQAGQPVSWNYPSATMSKAESEGREVDQTWVMLACNTRDGWNDPAAPGSSRTKAQMCEHFFVDRPGSICTPERVDPAYFGKRVWCLQDQFDSAHIDIRGELLQHEARHLEQFSSTKLLELYAQGVFVDDTNPRFIDISTPSLGAWLEFGAQLTNMDSYLDDFYHFVLTEKRADGSFRIINNHASTAETLTYLHQVCGDPSEADPVLVDLISRASLMDSDAYDELSVRCGSAPHELVADYTRQ